VLAKDAVCIVRPCAFGGVYHPALGEASPKDAGRVLLLNYSHEELLEATVDGVAELRRTVCGAGRMDRPVRHTAGGREGARGRPEWCLDLAFMHGYEVLLSQSPLLTGPGHYNYKFDGDREVILGKKIAGPELGWCLGAGIKLLGRLGRA
ncbi:hypothetical protein DFH09DRAFT_1389867, partial [Mycena vulgaris]